MQLRHSTTPTQIHIFYCPLLFSCFFIAHLCLITLQFLFFFNKLYFLEQFYVHSKIEGKVRRFSIYPLPTYMHSLSHYQHPYQSGTSVVPTLTQHHPKSVVYFRVHSWCTFCGFGHTFQLISTGLLWQYPIFMLIIQVYSSEPSSEPRLYK